MTEKDIACVMIVACVCAQDGLISQSEERVMLDGFRKKYPEISEEKFDEFMDKFFNSTEVIEDYINKVDDSELRTFTLFLAKKSASIDGLDFRENIALQKISSIWSQ
jgi:hypothetical protein